VPSESLPELESSPELEPLSDPELGPGYNIPYIQGEVKKPWLLFKARGNDSLSFSLPVSLCLLLIYPKTLTKKKEKKAKIIWFLVGMVKAGPTVWI